MPFTPTSQVHSVDPSAVLFDWDGTMASTAERVLHCIRTASAAVVGRRFPSTPEEERQWWRLNGWGALPFITEDVPEQQRISALFDETYSAPDGPEVVLFEGVHEALDILHQAGCRVGVITAKVRPHFLLDLERLELTGRVDAAVCGDDVTTEKPDPEGLLLVLEKLGLPSRRSVMVGDSPQDIGAGLAAGALTVGVKWGYSYTDTLLDAGAHALAATPAELPHVITELLGQGSRPANYEVGSRTMHAPCRERGRIPEWLHGCRPADSLRQCQHRS